MFSQFAEIGYHMPFWSNSSTDSDRAAPAPVPAPKPKDGGGEVYNKAPPATISTIDRPTSWYGHISSGNHNSSSMARRVCVRVRVHSKNKNT